MWHGTSSTNTARPESAVPHCLTRWCTKAYLLKRLWNLGFFHLTKNACLLDNTLNNSDSSLMKTFQNDNLKFSIGWQIKIHYNQLFSFNGSSCRLKTEELILFTKKKELKEASIELNAGVTKISSVNSIRALGISIDRNLDWTTHINNLQRKFSSLMSGLRIIARKLDQAQLYKVVTSQVFSILFYSSPVWSKASHKRLQTYH